ELHDQQTFESAQLEMLNQRKAKHEEEHLGIKERAREAAMRTRLVSVAWGLAPFAFWILVLGLRYLWLTLEPEQNKRSEVAVIWLSIAVAVVSVLCMIEV